MRGDATRGTLDRLAVVLSGAGAGAAAWVLVEIGPGWEIAPRAYLALCIAAALFFGGLLSSVGPLSVGSAALTGAILAAPITAFEMFASMRFDAIEPFLQSWHPPAAGAVIALIALPFLIAGFRIDQEWAAYRALFDNVWGTVVRVAGALAFAALGWGVVWLGDKLLGLVDITVIADLIKMEATPYILTGLLVGAALAAFGRPAEPEGTGLVVKLLRVLLPVVLVVTAVFLAALPLRGLSEAFGGYSIAGTLLTVAFTAATLVTVAVGRSDRGAVSATPMRWAAALMALLLPALAGIALAAVILRVRQHGWSPDRLAALSAASVLLGHGLLYGAAVLRGMGWMDRLRRGNVIMAIVTLLVALAWLTPAINPQRISALSQERRYESGRITADQLDVETMMADWGRAGASALQRLGERPGPDAEVIDQRVAEAGERMLPLTPKVREAADPAILSDRLQVHGGGDPIPADILGALPEWRIAGIMGGCERVTSGGRPGCLAIRADLLTDIPGDEIVVVYLNAAQRTDMAGLAQDTAGAWQAVDAISENGGLGSEDIDQIAEGSFAVAPLPRNVLRLEGGEGGGVTISP